MKSIIYSIFFILSLWVTGCSGITDFSSGLVNGYVSESALYVNNEAPQSIWFMAVERETAASINWARTKRGKNEIRPGDTKKISLSEIFGYEKGDEILFYYWTSTDPDEDLHHIVINTD